MHQQEVVRRAMGSLAHNPLQQMPELFAAALEEFSQRSYDDASLNNIIKVAGMNKGSFYYRFHNKLALYMGVFEEIGRQKLAFFADKAGLFAMPEDRQDFFAQIALMERAGLEFARHQPQYYRFWRRFMAESTAFRQKIKESFPEAGVDLLDAMLEQAIAQGQFRGDVSPRLIKGIILLLLYNTDNLIDVDAGDEEIITQLDQLNSVMRLGLGRVKPVEGLS
jgi:AcrR family transcriptional regulator